MNLAPQLPPNDRRDAETAPLLEGDHELASVMHRVDAVRGGEGGLVVIPGPGGTGKSSLRAAVARHARGRCRPGLGSTIMLDRVSGQSRS